MILYAVRAKGAGVNYVITMAQGETEARAEARQHLHMPGDPDQWDVIPITEDDATVVLSVIAQ